MMEVVKIIIGVCFLFIHYDLMAQKDKFLSMFGQRDSIVVHFKSSSECRVFQSMSNDTSRYLLVQIIRYNNNGQEVEKSELGIEGVINSKAVSIYDTNGLKIDSFYQNYNAGYTLDGFQLLTTDVTSFNYSKDGLLDSQITYSLVNTIGTCDSGHISSFTGRTSFQEYLHFNSWVKNKCSYYYYDHHKRLIRETSLESGSKHYCYDDFMDKRPSEEFTYHSNRLIEFNSYQYSTYSTNSETICFVEVQKNINFYKPICKKFLLREVYDVNQNLIDKSLLDIYDSKIFEYEIFQYDSKNRLLRMDIYRRDKTKCSYSLVYKYDDDYNEKSETLVIKRNK